MNNFKNKLKVFASATILCSLAFNATAQTETEPTPDPIGKRLEFGARFMPTIASFDMKTSEGNTIKGEGKFGYGIGGFIGYNLAKHAGIQAEALYFSISQTNTDQGVTRKVDLKYLNIPLLLLLNTSKAKPINLSVVVGPQIGLSAGSNVKTTGGDGSTTQEAVVVVKKGDLGFAYGAGLDFGINTKKTVRLGIGFRGVYGLLDISDDSQTTSGESYLILDKTHITTYSGYVGLSILL